MVSNIPIDILQNLQIFRNGPVLSCTYNLLTTTDFTNHTRLTKYLPPVPDTITTRPGIVRQDGQGERGGAEEIRRAIRGGREDGRRDGNRRCVEGAGDLLDEDRG